MSDSAPLINIVALKASIKFLLVYAAFAIPFWILVSALCRRKEKKLMARLRTKYPEVFGQNSDDSK